jgi:hypothetical protein
VLNVAQNRENALSARRFAVFPATLVIFLFVLLPIVSIWFGVDSRDHGARQSQW